MKASFLLSFRTWAPALLCVLAAGFHASAGNAAQAEKEQPVVSPAYVLQAGDELAITTGRPELDAVGMVAPDGVLYLKSIGQVRAAGHTIPQLAEQIQKVLEKKLRKPKVTVSLTKQAPPLPPDTITVVGSVIQPGPKSLVPDLRVGKAIELAGGPSKDADLAKVVIIHKGLTRTAVDLSTPEKLSDPKQNVELKDGDSIYVPLLPPKPVFTITVSGSVMRAGALVLDDAPRVFKAIELSGGAMKDADLTQVTVQHKDLTRTIVDLSTPERIADQKHNLQLVDEDSVVVPSQFASGTVSVEGAVVNEGTYELKPGWKVDDLIKEAGKLTILADVEHLELRRQGEKPIAINLVEHQGAGTPKIVLKPNDHLIVPRFADTVKLTGGVANPGLRPLKKGATIRQFLLNDNTDVDTLNNTKIALGKAKLFRGEDPAIQIDLRKILDNPKDKRNMILQDGDTLFLPGKEPRTQDKSMVGIGLLNVLSNLFAF